MRIEAKNMTFHNYNRTGTNPSITGRETTLYDKTVCSDEILFITSYPPRECGIATYSNDLVKALNKKFKSSFQIRICPLESENERHTYVENPKFILNTDRSAEYSSLAKSINDDPNIRIVLIQHEFGFFSKKEEAFRLFLSEIKKPIVVVFHTVIPHPDESLKVNVLGISAFSDHIIVMTNSSSKILVNDYEISHEKITVISHGTHLVPHADKEALKRKYNYSGRRILCTFGLLSSGKQIETTLAALPEIVRKDPLVLFLIIGKTHPSIVKQEGEKYRESLESMIANLRLEKHVQFINYFLPLNDLLEYLQLTDIYLFTSKDPNQAVSGTFSYAISCGCPIISTPIPHAREVLRNETGIIIDFGDSKQLEKAVVSLLGNEQLRKDISINGLHKMASTAWENSAIAHGRLLEKISESRLSLTYHLPPINLDHLKKLTTDFGMIQFSKINQPDHSSGYTLDDNARALIAISQHFELTSHVDDLKYIRIYFNFIRYCLQPEGNFLNYIDKNKFFTNQNQSTNLDDSNGRAIWALGYLISLGELLPKDITAEAETVLNKSLVNISKIHSSRAMAFVIKGLYYRNKENKSDHNKQIIKDLANRLIQMFRHEEEKNWQWFESYLTYANSILPEALLCAWHATGELIYKEVAKSSFDFLLQKIFSKDQIQVISNRGWLYKGKEHFRIYSGGEQPIDVSYTILAMHTFIETFGEESYHEKMDMAFSWFLGNNHLHQIIYNPCTGGCYDGLEENNVNLNQGAESTVSYLMARLTMEKYNRIKELNRSTLSTIVQPNNQLSYSN